MKVKIVEDWTGCYNILYKKYWFSRWKYVKKKEEPNLPMRWQSKRGAQGYINLKKNNL